MKILDELQAEAIGNIYGCVCKEMFKLLCEIHPYKSRDKILRDVLDKTYGTLEMYCHNILHQK